ncbi:MAG: glycerate kinase [Bacteroidia bacterium]|nr:glycerate kinase [Bacteroidia bacterium]
MRWLIAPDKFKDSLTAADAARAMAEGIRLACPEAELVLCPLADGGEGTAEALLPRWNGSWAACGVHDPLMRPIQARYLRAADGRRAFIETAAAAGLQLLAPQERNPMHTTTYGVGELIRHAVAGGAEEIFLGLGGSATHDGGAGMAAALGVQLLDAAGRPVPPSGARLAEIRRVLLPPDWPFGGRVQVRAACDVRNPLCGPQGAAAVYAPQKGARPEDLPLLDGGLRQLAACWAADLGRDTADLPGAGAAGGLGGGAAAFLGAGLVSGAELVLDAAGFDTLLQGCSLVLTGEGRLDAQTGEGKLIAAVCARAQHAGVPAVAVCGTLDLPVQAWQSLGLAYACSMLPGPMPLRKARRNAYALLREAAAGLACWMGRPA